jgi:hypothetical protein
MVFASIITLLIMVIINTVEILKDLTTRRN